MVQRFVQTITLLVRLLRLLLEQLRLQQLRRPLLNTRLLPRLLKAPKAPKPVKKSPKAKPIGTPDDDGKPIKGDNKTDAEIAAMRNRKLENAIDENGDPVYAKDINGNLLTDKKGRPIPLQDTDAILAALRADYPDAKLDNMGNVVVHREMYKAEDGSEKMFEVLVHLKHWWKNWSFNALH